MAARAVQVSLSEDLLHRIDADPEARRAGRSAFLRAAAEHYLELRRRQSIDDSVRRAYRGSADQMLLEVSDFLGAQAWPKK
jgi:metal-responsive CopG/Arc/MetJ family transcriptional regulator